MPSKPNILIVGQSGSGKSSSLEQLFRKHGDKIAFIDLERKGLPFLFDTTKLCFHSEPKDFTEAQVAMTAAKASKSTIFVYDSLQKYLEYVREYATEKHKGWDIWTFYNQAIGKFLAFNKSLERLVIITSSDEVVYIETAEGSRVSRLRASVPWGKEWEGKIEKEFLIVTFVYAKKDLKNNNKIKHVFANHTDGMTSAKSPQWLNLPDETTNDVLLVVDKLFEQKQI